jgi:uncharacterized protein YndB with AHSA1/START domain
MSRDERKPDTRSIELAFEIRAPIEAVFRALTEAGELVRWFPLEAGENPDGSIWMSWGDGARFSGRAADTDPPHRVRFVYRQPPPGRDPSSLRPEDFAEIATEYVLESPRGKTILRLVHSGFGGGSEWDDQFDATRTGWEVELRGLRHYLENHRGRDRLVAWARAPYAMTRPEAWDRLMSPSGLLANGSLEELAEGSPYRIRAANGDELEGVVQLLDPPRNFVATATNLGNSLLRVRLEDLYGRKEAHVWLSAYVWPRPNVEAFRDRWQVDLERWLTA